MDVLFNVHRNVKDVLEDGFDLGPCVSRPHAEGLWLHLGANICGVQWRFTTNRRFVDVAMRDFLDQVAPVPRRVAGETRIDSISSSQSDAKDATEARPGPRDLQMHKER